MNHNADKDVDNVFKPGPGLDLLKQSLKESGLDNLDEIECSQASDDDDAVEAVDDPIVAEDRSGDPSQRGQQPSQSNLVSHPRHSYTAGQAAEPPCVAGTDATDRLSVKEPPDTVTSTGSDCSGSSGPPAAAAVPAAAAAESGSSSSTSSSSSRASTSSLLAVPTGKAPLPLSMTGGCGPTAPHSAAAAAAGVSAGGALSRGGSGSVAASVSSCLSTGTAAMDDLRPTLFLTPQTMSPGQLLQHAATNVQQQQAAAAAAACAVSSLNVQQQQQQGAMAATTGLPLTLATAGTQQLFIPHGSISLHAVPAAVGLPGQHAIMGHLVYAGTGSGAQATLHRFPAAALTSLTAAPLQSSSAYGVVGTAPAPAGKPLQRRNILPASPVPSSSADGGAGGIGSVHRLFTYSGMSSGGPHLAAGNQSASRVVAAAAAAAVAANPVGIRPASAAGTASPQPADVGMSTFVARPQQVMVTAASHAGAAGTAAIGTATAVISASAGTLPLLAQQSRLGGQSFFTRSQVLLPATAFNLATAAVPTAVVTTSTGSRQVILSTVSLAQPGEHDLRVTGSSIGGGAVLASGPLNAASIAALGGGAVAAGGSSSSSGNATSVAASTLAAACSPADGTLLLPIMHQSALPSVAALQQQPVPLSTASLPMAASFAVAAPPIVSSGMASATLVGTSGTSSVMTGPTTILFSSVLTPGSGTCLPVAYAQQQLLPIAAATGESTAAATSAAQIIPQPLTADCTVARCGHPAVGATDVIGATAIHTSPLAPDLSSEPAPPPTAVAAVDSVIRGASLTESEQLALASSSGTTTSSAMLPPPVEFPALPPAPRSIIDMRLYREQLHAAKRAVKLLAKAQQAAASALDVAAAVTSAAEPTDSAAASQPPPAQAQKSSSCSSAPIVTPCQETSANPAASGSDAATADGTDELPDFCWSSYLEETGSVGAPPSLFKHVEVSLRNNFTRGMKVEVPLPNSTESYWLATVLKANGPLLYLRYEGYGDDGSADFWLDGQSGAVQYIGWCSKNKKTLHAPDAIRHLTTNWPEFLVRVLQGAQTVPSHALEKGAGHVLVDRIRPGMRVEVQHALQPSAVWVCQILENVGGRLLLRYDGTDSAAHDFWLFFLHTRVHPVGWAKLQNYKYTPPDEIKGEHADYAFWNDILQSAVKEAEKFRLPGDIYQQHQLKLKPHQFVQGWKLEAVDPCNATAIRPATVVEVVSCYYFIVQIDECLGTGNGSADGRRINGSGETAAVTAAPVRFCCHGQSKEIMPAHWCQRHAVKLMPPRGWTKGEFRWDDYLQATHSQAAPESAFELDRSINGFKRGMKLEAVNPHLPHQLCSATITKVVDRLLWIHLDHSTKMVLNHIVDMDSFDIFPIGWCESNNCMLKPPRKLPPASKPPGSSLSVPGRPLSQRRAIAMALNCDGSDDPYGFAKAVDAVRAHDDTGGSSHQMCPKIYINHSCFSGPLLSKGRLAELPRWVGPGRMVTVLREVLTMLVSIAYKSSRVLRELQMGGEEDPSMHQQVLKTKYKGKNYRAMVEMCKDPGQLDDYCRQVCLKLECCPNLISTTPVLGLCPDGCYDLTKTKYNQHFGKKKQKKVGRPPGGLSNLENGARRGRRRRRPKQQQQQRVALLSRRLPGGGGDAIDHSHGSPSSVHVDGHWSRVSPLNGSGDADRRPLLPSSSDSRPAGSGPLSNGDQGPMAVRAAAGSEEGAPLPAAHRLVLQVMPQAGASSSNTVYPPPVPRKRGRPPKSRQPAAAEGGAMAGGHFSSSAHGQQGPQLKSPRLAASALQQQMKTARPAKQPKLQSCGRPVTAFHSGVATSPPHHGLAVTRTLSVHHNSALSPSNRPPQYVRPEERVHLDSNPLHWTKERVSDFVLTTDCANLSKKLLDSDFDGQAFMLLNLPAAQEYLELKLGPAIKLCHHVERLKLAYYETYCPPSMPAAAAAASADTASFISASHFEN